MKYRMLKKDEWIYQSKGDEFSGFPDKWVPTMNGDKEARITDADVGYYRRPIPEPKRRAKMIAVDGHRERVKHICYTCRYCGKMRCEHPCNKCTVTRTDRWEARLSVPPADGKEG